MSDTQEQQTYTKDKPYDGSSGASKYGHATRWVGFLYFAGTMAMMVGAFQALVGLTAILNDDYFAVTRNGLVLSWDFTVWGWIHIVIALITIATGVGIFLGRTWARITGIVIASLGALTNLAFLPAYPLWSTVIIAMDILVIYALTVHGDEPSYA